MALPSNLVDNMPLRVWPASNPQYENWYGLVNHPTRRFAFWFRYTLLSTSTGVREARVWAIPVDADEPKKIRVATQSLPMDSFRADHASGALSFGDAGLVAPGKISGAVRDAQGGMEWDLSFSPSTTTFLPVASEWVRKLLTSSSHRSPNSAIRISGHVTVNGERIDFKDASAHQGHTEGSRMQERWVWGRAGGFESDHDAAFEGVGIYRAGKKMCSFSVATQGQDFKLNTLSHLRGPALGLLGRGNKTEWEPGTWRMEGGLQRRKIVVNVNATGMVPTKVRYMDTNGEPKFISMFPLASCAVSITPSIAGGNVSSTLLSKGRANMEFSSPTPLVGTADEYLPHS